jgi:hypothetical protein
MQRRSDCPGEEPRHIRPANSRLLKNSEARRHEPAKCEKKWVCGRAEVKRTYPSAFSSLLERVSATRKTVFSSLLGQFPLCYAELPKRMPSAWPGGLCPLRSIASLTVIPEMPQALSGVRMLSPVVIPDWRKGFPGGQAPSNQSKRFLDKNSAKTMESGRNFRSLANECLPSSRDAAMRCRGE